MSSGAAPVKKKPLIFKRQAGPVASSAPPNRPTNAPSSAIHIDDSDSDLDLDSSPPRPKTSSISEADNSTSGLDLFRRSKQFFPKAIEEQNRRLQAQKGRKQHPATATAGEGTITPPSPNHDTKRRKVSHESQSGRRRNDERDLSILSPVSPTAASPDQRGKASIGTSLSPTVSPSVRPKVDKGKGIATTHNVNAQIVFTDSPSTKRPTVMETEEEDSLILLEDAHDSAVTAADHTRRILNEETTAEKPVSNQKPLDNEEDDGIIEAIDPEFEEYIIRARARNAAARAAQAVQEAAGETQSTTATATLSAESARPGSASASQERPGLPSGDQNFRIFITPHFPEPVPPLIANVRMDQKMIFVQNAFLDHAQKKGVTLSSEEVAGVLLTWKGNKIYSWTTGQSLGIRPDASGRFRDESELGAHHAGFVSGGLHLEIWTQALYEAYQQEQEKRRLRNLGEMVAEDLVSSDDEDVGAANGGGVSQAEGGPGGAAAGADERQRVRLVLKSRDHEKLSMTAHSDTPVSLLIAAFREQRKIGLDKTVAIYWDGDKLDEDTTVGEAEMEDMDSVEVHVH